MKILCTGGAGYVGSACLRWLLNHGHDPLAFDNLSEGNREAVPSDRLIVGDLADREALVRAVRSHGCEAVMHFAALTSVPESIDEPEAYYRVNVIGTMKVLDAMREVGIDRILFSSTAATYSFDETMPLTEQSDQKPRVPYGTTKLAAEAMIKDYSRAYGLSFAILRYFNACGADPDGQHGEDRRHESHLIPLILHAALGRRDKVKIFGDDWDTRDGTCVRDYVHVSDLAQAHQLALEALEDGGATTGLVYNLGNGHGTTVLEVLRACEEVVGHPIPHEMAGRRAGDPGVLVATSEKIKRELGWSPSHADIRDIVATAWKWHELHPDGYGRGRA